MQSNREDSVENRILALELSASAVKLVKARWVESSLEFLRADQIAIPAHLDSTSEEKVLKNAIHTLLKGEELSSQPLLVSINSPHTCFGRFVIPKIPHKEISEVLKWKMQESNSFPTQDAILDYRLSEIPGTGREPRFVALTAATPRDAVNRYFQILLEAGIPSYSATYSVFSINHLKGVYPKLESEVIAVLDFGDSMTEVSFYDNGKLSFVRKLGFGAQSVSNALTQSLVGERGKIALSKDEATNVLAHENLFESQSTRLVAGKMEVSKLFTLIRPELEKLVNELDRSFDFYNQEYSKSVNSVLIGGGFSQMEGLCGFLAAQLDLPVTHIKPESFSVTKGISAQNGLSPFFRLMNTVHDRPELAFREELSIKKRTGDIIKILTYPKVAAVSLCAFLILSGGLIFRDYDFHLKTGRLNSQIQNLKPGFDFAQKIRMLEAQIDGAQAVVQALSTGEPAWNEVFKELAFAIPREAVLSEFNYQNNGFILKGVVFGGNSQTVLSNMIMALQGPIFKKVTLLAVEQKPELKQAVFTLRCEP